MNMTQQAYAPAPAWYAPPQEWYPPPPPPPPKPTWWKRRWIWLTSVSVAVVVAGGAWFCVAYNTHQQELRVAHQQQVAAQQAEQQRQAAEQQRQVAEQARQAAEAKQLADAAQVKSDMQTTLDNDPTFGPCHLVVSDVRLVKADGNHYDGIATVHGPRGINHSVMVHVTVDDTNIMWRTDSGAFLWAAYE
jgi:hypothetical protein